MKQVVRQWSHAALWVLAMVVLASTLATIVGAAGASSPSYKLTGVVEGGAPGYRAVPAGVQVDLISRATGGVYSTTITGTGGGFAFTSSGTGNVLVPGWWGIYVPPQTNITLAGCKPVCGILPPSTSPQFAYYNSTDLTTTTYETTVANVTVVAYTATVSGIVKSAGTPVAGATVSLLAPTYNDISLVNNTTLSNGSYSLKVPVGTWILKTTWATYPSDLYNTTVVTIAAGPNSVSPNIQQYLVSGRAKLASGSPVVGLGNVTLYNTATHDILSAPTDTGYYSIGTYPGSFDVIVATAGYTTAWFPLTVAGPGQVLQNVTVAPAPPPSLALYNTTVNLTGLFPYSGTGNAVVTTNANLGNNSVFPTLGNSTVRQIWAQLGLDYTGTTTFPSTDNAAVASWINSSGPFFPAVQAGLAVNGTGFLSPTVAPTLLNFNSACAASCGLSSPGGFSFGWSSTYVINGTVTRNASSYTLAFGFRHPSSPSEVFNYTFVLPADYLLAASTSAPPQTTLSPEGIDNTWTSFTLSSLASTTPIGAASFSIVRAANLTANVNISEKTFTFSSLNVLNSTHNNYTVIVGVNQNVTFSALNSTYPAGTNGTKFVWNFGDGSAPVTTRNGTSNHTFTTVSGTAPFNGTLNVTSSGGITNETTFYVWVASGSVKAGLAGNWSAAQYNAAGPYAKVNWSTTLGLNATNSVATISPTAPIHNVIAISVFTFTARGFKYVVNYSASARATPLGNLSYQFLGAGAYYASGVTVNGTAVALKGWQYNVTLQVWTGTGQTASTKFTILVNDTEPPVAAFKLQNSGGKAISGSGIQVASNGTAKVVLNASNATDPHNGSISRYYWLITNIANSTAGPSHIGINASRVRPNGTLPAIWLQPSNHSYAVNLTVWDLNGNHAYTVQPLSVSVNSSLNVIMSAENLTAPTSYNAGSSYTFWVNISVGGGASAIARNVSVAFYLLSPAGTGSRSYIGGTTTFFNYVGGVVNSTVLATGLVVSMNFNTTLRAQVTWTPSKTGNFLLYANVTAQNEWVGNYVAGTNLDQQSITVNQNPTTTLLIDLAIVAAGIVVVLLIVFLFWRRAKKRSAPPTRPGRSSSSSKTKEKDAKDDDEDEDET